MNLSEMEASKWWRIEIGPEESHLTMCRVDLLNDEEMLVNDTADAVKFRIMYGNDRNDLKSKLPEWAQSRLTMLDLSGVDTKGDIYKIPNVGEKFNNNLYFIRED